MARLTSLLVALVQYSPPSGCKERRFSSWPAGSVEAPGMNSRVHPNFKTKYRVTNWVEYDRALVQRGDLTLWIAPRGHPGMERQAIWATGRGPVREAMGRCGAVVGLGRGAAAGGGLFFHLSSSTSRTPGRQPGSRSKSRHAVDPGPGHRERLGTHLTRIKPSYCPTASPPQNGNRRVATSASSINPCCGSEVLPIHRYSFAS
ncbi:MAG: hypothetical protein ACI9F9_001710 [Candidatus Paceibacteria bacterium]|jgi:hypothetical protein